MPRTMNAPRATSKTIRVAAEPSEVDVYLTINDDLVMPVARLALRAFDAYAKAEAVGLYLGDDQREYMGRPPD
jgi:hypothetical protein